MLREAPKILKRGFGSDRNLSLGFIRGISVLEKISDFLRLLPVPRDGASSGLLALLSRLWDASRKLSEYIIFEIVVIFMRNDYVLST